MLILYTFPFVFLPHPPIPKATGGPVNTAIMGNWFPKKGRGLVFGLWTCHQYTGDIVAAFAGAAILNSALNW